MNKKNIITILIIISFVGMELTPFFSAHALIPPDLEKDQVIESAPESFEKISFDEILICKTGLYSAAEKVVKAVTNFFKNLASGASRGAVGSQKVEDKATEQLVQQACKEWIQREKEAIKKKKAEITKLVLRMYAKRMMDLMVSQTVDWISGKTTGKPQFITNWKAFFETVADQTLGEYIANSPFSELCEPFRFSVRVNTQLPGKPPFPRCTLSMVVKNIESFYDNFTNGGWIAFEESYYPWNNAFGAWMMSQEAAEQELAKAKEAAEKETQSGYTPTKRCLIWKTDSVTGNKKCLMEEISIPSQTKADIASKALTTQLDKTDSYFITSADLTAYGEIIGKAIIARIVKSAVNQKESGSNNLYGSYGSGLLNLPEKSDVKDNLELHYACNSYGESGETVSCEIDPNGPYNSLKDCENYCKTPSYRWGCDSDVGICIFDSTGQYSDYTTCQNNCQQEVTSTPSSSLNPSSSPSLENHFTCTNDGECIPDANGEFTNLQSCIHYCQMEHNTNLPSY